MCLASAHNCMASAFRSHASQPGLVAIIELREVLRCMLSGLINLAIDELYLWYYNHLVHGSNVILSSFQGHCGIFGSTTSAPTCNRYLTGIARRERNGACSEGSFSLSSVVEKDLVFMTPRGRCERRMGAVHECRISSRMTSAT